MKQRLRQIKFIILANLISLRKVLNTESAQSRRMLDIYYRQLRGDATKNEIIEANTLFRELLKTIGFGAYISLPFTLFTLPLISRLGKYFKINILPKSFDEWEKNIKQKKTKEDNNETI